MISTLLRCALLLLGAGLLTTGCVTLAPLPGGSSPQGPRAFLNSHPTPSSLTSLEVEEPERLHRRRSARGLGSHIRVVSGEAPPGWPDFSSGDEEALLAPFLTCTSPADFLALQQRVDMPRLVEALNDWRAVRLGAQGTPREDAAVILNRKRTSFLLGVPLGFYGLLAGTGHGAYSLSQGEYEQATRELAPAVLWVGLYAGGKGARYLSEARGAAGAGMQLGSGFQALEGRVRGLQELARQLEAKLGVDGLRELARDIRASREAGRFVAVGGVDAALALREARGDVAQAQAMMSKARPGATGSSVGRHGAEQGAGQATAVADDATRPFKKAGAAERSGSMASLVDEGAGLTREVVEARLALVELEATGPRLPRDVAVLEKQRPSPDAPPPGAEGNPRWGEYVAYYEKRLAELQQGKAAQAPLRWAPYEQMWGWFTRGLAFERLMVASLEADAALPRAQRRFLGAFIKPHILRYVGVMKPESGLRYADVLVIETGELVGGTPRVETFSFKSRNLSRLEKETLKAQMTADAREALHKYGGALEIRRASLQPLLREGSKVPTQRVHLVYEGGTLKPKNLDALDAAMTEIQEKLPGVEVLFQ